MNTKNFFAELFQKYIKPIILKPGCKIKGTIIAFKKESFLVDVGLKSDTLVPISEFKNCHGELSVKLGDKIDFILEDIEDGSGSPIISREKAKREETWIALQEAHKEGTKVYGKVINKVKGGLSLYIEGIKAFLPGSLVDLRLNKEFLQDVKGKIIELKVIKLDHEKKTVVVSRKAVLEVEHLKAKQAMLENLQLDNIITGHVKNITDYGAFIDLGNGLDGLLHITDISWKRIKHPKLVLTIGQSVKLKIIKIDSEKKRISLGLKQLTDNPWNYLLDRYPVGHIFKGKVSNILNYGCFVEIEDGIEGLVHISEMAWLHKGLTPENLVEIGQKVKVVILYVDNIKRRISLGMKQCLPNPWHHFCKNYQVGDILKGRIKSITDFGLFVEIEKSSLYGLVHISDISWKKFHKSIFYKIYKKGSNIKFMILKIDLYKERIALGIKQIIKSPYSNFIRKVKKGHIFIGKVIDYDESTSQLSLKFKNIKYNIIKIYLNKSFNNFFPIKIHDIFKVKIINFEEKLIKIYFL